MFSYRYDTLGLHNNMVSMFTGYPFMLQLAILLKGVELIRVWCRSTSTKLKPVHVLGDIYLMMSCYDLDVMSVGLQNTYIVF